MSQNSSLLSANRRSARIARNEARLAMAPWQSIKLDIQSGLKAAYRKVNRNLPKGTERYAVTEVDNGLVASLTATLPDGHSRTYMESNKIYASREEARNAVYQYAYRTGILDFISSTQLGVETPLPLTPSLGPVLAPMANSSSSSAIDGAEPAGPELPPPETVKQEDLDALVTSFAPSSPGPTQPPTDLDGLGTMLTHAPSSSSNDLLLPQPVAKSLPTESTSPSQVPTPPVISPTLAVYPVEQSGVKDSSGLAGLASGFISRLVGTILLQRAGPPKGTKRARADDETAVAWGSFHGGHSEDRPMKKFKVVHGASYADILADYCLESGLEQPKVSFKRRTGSSAVIFMSALVGSIRFELLKTCESVEAGVEMLSKIALGGLGVDMTRD